MPRDRALYSVSLADSWKQQTLLNIVKVRYIDPPVFVDIGSIVASYSLSQGGAVGGTIQPSGTSTTSGVSLGGSVTFSNTPTITYTPLTGNGYIKGLMTPLPPAVVFGAIQNGLPADLILLSSVASVNGFKNQQAGPHGVIPADPEFHRARELLRRVQLSGMVSLYVKTNADKQLTSILVLPTKNIPSDVQAVIAELRALLHLSPGATEFTIVAAPLPSSDTEIAVLTRSIDELMQNMAAQVEVPPEDVAQHRAFPGFEAGKELPGVVRIIRIHSSKKKPDDSFVSVYYRDMWFWIDDGDLASKRSFSQLMKLFTMTDTGSRENLPTVTIPAR